LMVSTCCRYDNTSFLRTKKSTHTRATFQKKNTPHFHRRPPPAIATLLHLTTRASSTPAGVSAYVRFRPKKKGGIFYLPSKILHLGHLPYPRTLLLPLPPSSLSGR
jgi:hypothetical protein